MMGGKKMRRKQGKPKYTIILQTGNLAAIKISARTKSEVARIIRVAESNGITAKLEEVKP